MLLVCYMEALDTAKVDILCLKIHLKQLLLPWGKVEFTEKAMAPHSSTLAWKIPWMEEPGRLQSMGSRRVGHDWATSLSLFTFLHWRRKWQPTPVFLPGESQGLWSLVAAVYGVTQSRTWLKWLSSKVEFKPVSGKLAAVMKHSYLWRISTPQEKALAPHSCTLAWKIPWTEEPGRLQSMG